MPNHYGVDISSNNPHPIAWAALHQHLLALGDGLQPFVIIKVNQGTGYINSEFAGDHAAALTAGFAVGGYLMDQGNVEPGAEETTFLAHSLGVPQFDDDELPEGLSTKAYIAHLQILAAVKPAPQYLNQAEEDEGFPTGIGIWEANYNKRPTVTHRSNVLMHQYDDAGVIPGVNGVFDMNIWLGSEQQFEAMFHGTIPPTPIMEASDMILVTPSGQGYWQIKRDGSVYTFGDATYLGGCNPGAVDASGRSTAFAAGDYATGAAASPIVVGGKQGYIIEAASGHLYAFGCVPSKGDIITIGA